MLAAHGVPQPIFRYDPPDPPPAVIAPTSDIAYRKKLFHLLLAVAIPGCAYLYFTRPPSVTPLTGFLAILVMLVSLAPAAVYLNKRDPEPMPALTLIGIFYLVCFAIPVFSAERTDFVMLRPDIVSPAPLAIVLSGILLFYLGYGFSKSFVFAQVRPLRLPAQFQDGWLRSLLWLLMIPHLAILVWPQLRNIPSAHSLFDPAGYVAFGMFFLLWANGRLPLIQTALVSWVCLPLEILACFSSGALLLVVMFGLFAQIVYWYFARRVPWRLVILVCVLFVPLQAVKDQFRQYTWYQGRYSNIGIVGKAKLFGEIAWNYYTKPHADRGPFYRSATGRLAHIRLLAYVMRESPAPVPYWEGETYKPLLTKFVPRFLWADKPREIISHELGHRYSLIEQTDHVTAVNLPWLIELWVNFGPAGLFIGMPLFGALFGYLTQKLNRGEMTALEFVVGATLLFPLCVDQESHFSVVAGNLFLLYISLYAYFHIGYLLQPRPRSVRGARVVPRYAPRLAGFEGQGAPRWVGER